jgi:hypothetical protein
MTPDRTIIRVSFVSIRSGADGRAEFVMTRRHFGGADFESRWLVYRRRGGGAGVNNKNEPPPSPVVARGSVESQAKPHSANF